MMRALLVAIILVKAGGNGFAQDLMELVKETVAFNVAFKAAYIGTNGFSARVAVEVGQTNAPLKLTLRQDGSKFRGEMRLSESGPLWPQIKQMLQKAGIDELVVVMDTSTNRIRVVFPGVSAYISMVAPPSILAMVEQIRDVRFERTLLANEAWQNRPCEKVHLEEPGARSSVTAWERPDLNHFPVRMEVLNRGETMTLSAESVELIKPPATAFEVPSGFTRYATFAEVAKAASRALREQSASPASTAEPQ